MPFAHAKCFSALRTCKYRVRQANGVRLLEDDGGHAVQLSQGSEDCDHLNHVGNLVGEKRSGLQQQIYLAFSPSAVHKEREQKLNFSRGKKVGGTHRLVQLSM